MPAKPPFPSRVFCGWSGPIADEAAGKLVELLASQGLWRKGQVIDLPLYDPLFAIMGPQAAQYRLTGKLKPRTGSRSTNSSPRNAYRCEDGKYVGLSGSTQTMAERVMRTIGRPELVDDPRFRTNADRLKNVEALDSIIADFFAKLTQADAVDLMEKAEVTVGPIYDASQILADPHVIEREILADYEDPDVGAFPMHHVAPRLDGTPGSIRSPAPTLGQHNRELLAEIGVDGAAYEALKAVGTAVEGDR